MYQLSFCAYCPDCNFAASLGSAFSIYYFKKLACIIIAGSNLLARFFLCFALTHLHVDEEKTILRK